MRGDKMKNNCPLCKAFKSEKTHMVNSDYFLVNAKSLKGHKKRYLLCSITHRIHGLDQEGLSLAVREGLRLFKSEPFLVIFGVKASIKDHWHVIICDRILDSEVVNVFEEPRIEVFPVESF